MKNKIYDVFIWIVTIALITGVFFLPPQIPLHWNLDWQIDRYGSRYEFLIIVLIPITIYYGMLFTKKIDPRFETIQKRNQTYELIRKILSFFLILLIIFFYILIINPKINGTFILCFLIGLLFIVIGNYMPKFPQNYFMGIRTPWTLSNEKVWKQTHRISGYWFVVGGIFIVLGAFMPYSISFILLLIISLAISILSIVYSYLIYKKID